MTSAKEVHLKLLASLPVKTVAAKSHEESPDTSTPKRNLQVGRRRFASVRAAMRELKLSSNTIYNMIGRGEAWYV